MRAGLRILLAAALPCGALAASPEATDTPAWRAQHGVLLGIAASGPRLAAVGDRGTVLISNDQAAHWSYAPSGFDGLLTAIDFRDDKTGIAVGQDAAILATEDGGAHWTCVHSAPNSDQGLFAVIHAGTHWLVTGGYALMFESDDGKTWSQTKLPELDEDYHLNGVAAHGEDVLIAAESGQDLLRHAGTWSKIPVPYNGSQFGCLIAADGTFYSFGLRGSLFSRAPGAAQWTRIDLGTTNSLFGGVLLADGRLALVGGNGLAVLYDPAKKAHVQLKPPSHASLSGVVAGGEGRLIAVGDDGIHILNMAELAEAATQ